MNIETDPIVSTCATCGAVRVLVDQYERVSDDSVKRRFVCVGCYDALHESAQYFDAQIKLEIVQGLHTVAERRDLTPPAVKRKYVKKAAASIPPSPPPPPPPPPPDGAADVLLREVYRLSRKKPRVAIQMLLETIDDWVRASRWGDCNDLLYKAQPERLSPAVSLAMLTALRPADVHTVGTRKVFTRKLFESESTQKYMDDHGIAEPVEE